MILWTDEQIDSWCLSFRAYREDPSAMEKARDLQPHRCRLRQEVLRHLLAFLDGQHTLQEFNTALHYQTHPEWNLFGIHGLSGKTFLNKCVALLSRKEELTQHLRSVLAVPRDTQSAHQSMETLLFFLESVIAVDQMSRAQLQPARVPLFLSIWWSLQDGEMWPRFTGTFRQRLFHGLPLTDPIHNQVALYFAFRERFLALKTAFGISAWELEQFLLWQQQQEHERENVMVPATPKRRSISFLSDASRRLQLQWLLAKIGKRVGCQIWLPPQDHEHSWNNEIFGQLSIPSLPALENRSPETSLEDVAVLWFLKEEMIAAYEIAPQEENITTSLLRLYDLSLTQAKRRTRLCLILPSHYVESAQQTLARPFFRRQQERHHCTCMSEENLLRNGEHILRWATSPTVIEDIIAFDTGEQRLESGPALA